MVPEYLPARASSGLRAIVRRLLLPIALLCSCDSASNNSAFSGQGRLLLSGQDVSAQWDKAIRLTVPDKSANAKDTHPMLTLEVKDAGTLEIAFEAATSYPPGTAVAFSFATIGGGPLPAPGRCVFDGGQASAVTLNCTTPSDGQSSPLTLAWALSVGSTRSSTGPSAQNSPQAQELIAAYQAQLAFLSAQAASDSPSPPAPAENAVPTSANLATSGSEDSRALFGLLVGSRAPRFVQCLDEITTEDPFPSGAAWCLSPLGTGMDSFFGELFNTQTEKLKALGLFTGSVLVNSKIYDTRLAEAVNVTVDKDETVHAIELLTYQQDPNIVVPMLSRKFGEPTGSDVTTWTNQQTGQAISETPNYYWTFADLSVLYESRAAEIGSLQSVRGRIRISSPTYDAAIADLERQKVEPLPDRRPM